MKKNGHFLASEISQAEFAKAAFHIIPAPLEHTVSYGGGTGKGPAAVIKASDQLELWNGRNSPGEAGIRTCRPVKGRKPEAFLANLQTVAAASLSAGAIPVTLGGEHTVTLGCARAVFERYGKNAGIIQIDAHADLRDSYTGTSLSHACVMRRIHEHTGWPIIQAGIRAMCKEERTYQIKNNITCLTSGELETDQIRVLPIPADFPENVYLTIDVDGFDPSVFAATGTPVPGGIGWHQGLDLIRSIAEQRRIIGFDLVELAPSKYAKHCDFAAAQLVYNVMGFITEQKK